MKNTQNKKKSILEVFLVYLFFDNFIKKFNKIILSMKNTQKIGIVLWFFALVFTIIPIFAVNYEDSKGVFDASIFYVNDQKLPYSIIINLEGKENVNLDYEIEVITHKKGQVVGEEYLSCQGKCETKVTLKKIFFENYDVIIRASNNGHHYEKKLTFKLDKKETKTEINIEDVNYIPGTKLLVLGEIKKDESFQDKYLFEIFPKNQEDLKQSFTKECLTSSCPFEFEITSNIFLGQYNVKVYSSQDTFQKSFNVILKNETNISLEENLSKGYLNSTEISNQTISNQSNIVQIEENIELTKDFILESDINILEENLFDENYKNLYDSLIKDVNSQKYIFNLAAEENMNYSIASIFYNDYIIKYSPSTQTGLKSNYFANFNISNYEIVYKENIDASINEFGYINIQNINKNTSLIILSIKNDSNMNYTQNRTISDVIENTVFIEVSKNILQEINSVEIKKKDKIKQKVLLPQKFSNKNYEFEIDVDENESKEISKLDNKFSRLIDKKQVSKNTLNYLVKKSNKINGTLKFSGRDISFSNLEIDETGIDLKTKKLNKRFELNQTNKKGESEKIILNDLFAIDPEQIKFQNATMTKVAKGKALYKCKDWNYSTDTCFGTWVKILDLVLGQEYSLELDKYDPAFAESNIIFEDDFELGGALQSGLWTTVVESDSKLTQVWGSDTQYKYAGSYSLSDSPGANYHPGAASTGFLPHHTIYTPAINLSGLTSANATFYQRLYLEPDTATSCWDAITAKVSINKSTWNYITITGYTMRTISDNNQAERTTGDGYAMCGQYTNWTQVSINLTPYVGNQTVYISWSLIADDNTAFDGYNLDNFVVYGTENQNPKLITNPSFNPNSIVLGSDSYLNMTITDDTPVNVIGTIKFSNGTIQNYTILPEVKSKINSYTVLSTSFTERGANVTVFNDSFTDLRYWFVTIGTGLFDWNINTAQLRATAVTAPRPQYAALAVPLDLRNYSFGVVQYQYKEQGTEEANDCLLYSLNNGSGWGSNTNIICDDLPLDNTYYNNNSILLNSSYMSKNFQFRFGADQFDAETVWIDNYNITAWHNESRTTGKIFGPITYDNYSEITRINVTITIDSYSPNSSVNKSNTKPDLYLSFNDGTDDDLFNEIGLLNLSSVYTGNAINTTDANFTISLTDSSVLNYFESNPSQRYLRIGAKYLDYSTTAIYDEIIYKSVIVTFEGSGSNNNYYYNFSNVQTPGTHNLTNIYITDYFGLTNNSIYANVNFTVNAYSIVNDGYLLSNNIYLGNISTIACNVIDNTTLLALNNYNVSFYQNTTLLGSNLTNSSGWSLFSFNDTSVSNSVYNISCNITSSPSTFYTVSTPNSTYDILYVWSLGADTEKPNIFSGNGTPILNNVGLGFNAWVNATDNEKVQSVYFYVKRPGEGTYTSYLMSDPGTLNGSGQYNYTFTGDSLSGTYYYYFRAEDNWTNPNWNTTQISSFSRVVSDALIKIKNKNSTYKKIQNVELISYTSGSISNTTVGEKTAYIGPYVIFNNSFADEFASWTNYTNPSGTALYSGDGGAGYENLDTDTGGSATSRTPGTDNSAARFSMEGSSYTLGGSGYAYFEQNLSLSGYTTANVTLYLADNGVPTQVGGGYPFTLDVYDGTWYQSFTQQGTGGADTAIIASDYSLKTVALSGYNMINNFRIRFSGGGTGATTDHFAVDDVLVVAVATDKNSTAQNYTFGNSNLNLSYFNVVLTISSYDNRGSISNTEADLSIEFFNGTEFISKNYCNLESLYGFSQSSSTTDINCSVEIVDKTIISAWENPQYRMIRVNSEYVDVSINGSDNINWTNVYFNYYTPSLIYNPGIINVSSYISNKIYFNLTGELKGTVNVSSITVTNGSRYNLSTTWNAQNLTLVDLPNGVYYSSSALTDGSGNILTDSNGEEIVSIDYFNIQNMYVNITSPTMNSTYNGSVWVNVTLDTTYYSSGSWCGYSLNSNATVNMTQDNSTHFSALLTATNFTSYENEVVVYCNDSTGDIVSSEIISFNVDTGFVVSFVSPTDNDDEFVNRSWTNINVSISTLEDTSGYINFNDTEVIYYSFNNISAGFVYDESNNSNNAQRYNVQINNTQKVRGNYSIYNRSNSEYLQIISPNQEFKDTIFSNNEFTISSWFNPSSISAGTKQILPIFERYNSSGDYLSISLESESGIESIVLIASNSSLNTTLSSGDINFVNGTWSHLTLTLDYVNSTYANVSIYYNGEYINSTFFERSKFSNLESNYYLARSISSSNYFNGSLDEFRVSKRVLSTEEIKALYNSKINLLQNNFSNLINGAYSYQACVIREDGNELCTEERTVNINKSLPEITIISPINNYKYNFNETLTFNITTLVSANNSYFEINSNGTNYNLSFVSVLNWNLIGVNLSGGYYNVTFFAIDEVGNMANATTYFYRINGKNIYIKKKIESVATNSYKITLNSTNTGNYTSYELHDFMQINFTYYNLSTTQSNSSSVLGTYLGTILKWVLSINSSNSNIITYNINGTSDYKLRDEFILGSG